MANDRQKCLDAGCNGYVSEPVNLQELFTTISEWTSRKQTRLASLEVSVEPSAE